MTTLTTQNLIVNGNAETGPQAADFATTDAPVGWTTTGGFTQVAYSAGATGDIDIATSAAINGGGGYFAGGPNSTDSSAAQTVDVSSYAAAIDAGSLGFNASGDFGGFSTQSDSMTMNLTFLAADGTTVLGTASLGGVTPADRAGNSEMLYRQAGGALPSGTRFIKVELDAHRTDGSYNDGYADNIALTLTGAAVPNGAVLVNSTHDFSTEAMPKSKGIVFDAGGAASATFVANDFGATRISLTGTITGDQNPDTLTIKFAANFNASGLAFQHWTAGVDQFIISGSSGNDVITGATVDNNIQSGSGNDVINLAGGGNDVVNAGAGDDTINMGAALTAADRIDGSSGANTVTLSGDYSSGLVLGSTTIRNVQTLSVAAGSSYNITSSNANLAAGQTLTVDGSSLGAADKLTFNGSHELDGHFVLKGGAGADYLSGGSQSDTLTGAGGTDTEVGGAGPDTFVYNAVSDSTGTGHDNLVAFDAAADKIDITGLGFTLAGMDATIASGNLTGAGFNANLAAAVGAAQLDPHHAVLFTPTTGGFVGHTFLVIDANGVAGYQAGQDVVIEISNAANMGTFGAGNIVG